MAAFAFRSDTRQLVDDPAEKQLLVMVCSLVEVRYPKTVRIAACCWFGIKWR
jgi:hypothetical protein